MTDLDTTIHNERTKLTANWLNASSIAIFAVGGLAPLFATIYGNENVSSLLVIGTTICFLASSVLHFVARRLLKGLKP